MKEQLTSQRQGLTLVIATLLMAVSGLVYELLAGTLSSYLLGDSTTQFSLVIGCFLTSMGLGSWLSRFVNKHYLSWLIGLEIVLGLLGGALALIGFAAYTYTSLYQPVLLGTTGIIGILVGLEIPIVIAILKDCNSNKINISNVLSADYIGALIASLLFPFLLVPQLGMSKSGIAAGAANVAVALVLTFKFRKLIQRHFFSLSTAAGGCLVALLVLYASSNKLVSHMEDSLYQDRVIFAKNSKFQRIVLTRWRSDFRLYLNGHLQFSTVDEYRYHETLVHPAMSFAPAHQSVLILGGGDGLALREVLKYDDVDSVTLVDLDPEVTALFSSHPILRDVNDSSLTDPRVNLLHADAMQFLNQTEQSYDVIIADLPDPSDVSLAKLYSKSFFGVMARKLRPHGVLVTQSTSPFRSREAFWCIHNTLKSIEMGGRALEVEGMHALVPTFGKWGFNLASFSPMDPATLTLQVPTRFLDERVLPQLFVFPKDIGPLETQVSTLDHPRVSQYYRSGYHRYLE